MFEEPIGLGAEYRRESTELGTHGKLQDVRRFPFLSRGRGARRRARGGDDEARAEPGLAISASHQHRQTLPGMAFARDLIERNIILKGRERFEWSAFASAPTHRSGSAAVTRPS
jgi:hypothetical protein